LLDEAPLPRDDSPQPALGPIDAPDLDTDIHRTHEVTRLTGPRRRLGTT
jgi:hypothetical protein